MKLEKLQEEDSVYNIDLEDSIHDMSMYSLDSITNSVRRCRKDTEGEEDVYGFAGATKGK